MIKSIITINERRESLVNLFLHTSFNTSFYKRGGVLVPEGQQHLLLDWQGSSAGPDEGSGQAVPVEEEGNLFTQRKCENAARRSSRTREE